MDRAPTGATGPGEGSVKSVRAIALNSQSEFAGTLFHCLNAEGDVDVEVDAELGCALNDVFAVDAAGEGFVFHLFLHARDFDVGDGFRRLDQGAGGEEAGQLIAGKEDFGEVRGARHAGVERVAKDCGAEFLGPAQALQFADADEGVLFGRGMALIVKIVEQSGG